MVDNLAICDVEETSIWVKPELVSVNVVVDSDVDYTLTRSNEALVVSVVKISDELCSSTVEDHCIVVRVQNGAIVVNIVECVVVGVDVVWLVVNRHLLDKELIVVDSYVVDQACNQFFIDPVSANPVASLVVDCLWVVLVEVVEGSLIHNVDKLFCLDKLNLALDKDEFQESVNSTSGDVDIALTVDVS